MAKVKAKKATRGNEWVLRSRSKTASPDDSVSAGENSTLGKKEEDILTPGSGGIPPSESPSPEFEPLRLIAIQEEPSGLKHYHIIEWVSDDSNLSCPRFKSQVNRVETEKCFGSPAF